MLASQVIAQVTKTFRVELPFRSLWESPTIADMAVLVVQDRLKAADVAVIERSWGNWSLSLTTLISKSGATGVERIILIKPSTILLIFIVFTPPAVPPRPLPSLFRRYQ